MQTTGSSITNRSIPQQPDLPQVPAAIQRLNAASLQLKETYSILVNRLGDVAVVAPSAAGAVKLMPSSTVPLANAIHEHASMLEDLTNDMSGLLDALQL